MQPTYQNDNVTLFCGDCLEVMPKLSREGLAVDLCLTDPPFGITECVRDEVIDVYLTWENLYRLVKPTASTLLFGTPPFTARLIESNLEQYKYNWYWIKSAPTGVVHSKNRPMACVEEICVFSRAPMGHESLLGNRRMAYYPQGIITGPVRTVSAKFHGEQHAPRPNQVGREYQSYTGFDNHVLNYQSVPRGKAIHPTQKPVDLLAYLIKCYTKEGETVLDFTAGSGSLAEACAETGRKCILIEKDAAMCEKIIKRMESKSWKN